MEVSSQHIKANFTSNSPWWVILLYNSLYLSFCILVSEQIREIVFPETQFLHSEKIDMCWQKVKIENLHLHTLSTHANLLRMNKFRYKKTLSLFFSHSPVLRMIENSSLSCINCWWKIFEWSWLKTGHVFLMWQLDQQLKIKQN